MLFRCSVLSCFDKDFRGLFYIIFLSGKTYQCLVKLIILIPFSVLLVTSKNRKKKNKKKSPIGLNKKDHLLDPVTQKSGEGTASGGEGPLLGRCWQEQQINREEPGPSCLPAVQFCRLSANSNGPRWQSPDDCRASAQPHRTEYRRAGCGVQMFVASLS